MEKATCAACKRYMTLINRNGTFRRHNVRRGETCPGSGRLPSDVAVAVAERQIQEARSAMTAMLQAWERHFGSIDSAETRNAHEAQPESEK